MTDTNSMMYGRNALGADWVGLIDSRVINKAQH